MIHGRDQWTVGCVGGRCRSSRLVLDAGLRIDARGYLHRIPDRFATLTLQEGSGSVGLRTGGFQGWVGNDFVNLAGPDGSTNDLAGVYNGFLLVVKSTVTSANLTLYSGTISAELDYSLYGATQAITQLSNAISPNPDTALYNELGQGVKYDSFVIDSGNSLHSLMFTLNAAAVSGVNAEILGKKTAIAISGAAIPVPEPSTWIMMLAGFAGLGLAAYRRTARGFAASTAG